MSSSDCAAGITPRRACVQSSASAGGGGDDDDDDDDGGCGGGTGDGVLLSLLSLPSPELFTDPEDGPDDKRACGAAYAT
jgi:hypothetical protein